MWEKGDMEYYPLETISETMILKYVERGKLKKSLFSM